MQQRIRAGVVMAMCLGGMHAPALAGSDDLRGPLERALDEEGLVGVVWVLVTPEGGIQAGAAGVSDVRTGAPMPPDARVHVGSVAKTIVATGVLRLVTEGRVALDDPIAAVLPDVAFDNPWAAADPIRVRHLLDHTAGLDDARLWQVFSLRARPDQPLTSAIGDGNALRVRTRPGSRFSYSNTGYALAGLIIERITGERYEAWLDRELLAPLRMHDSTLAFVSQEGPHADARLAMGHFEGEVPHAAAPIAVRPASQFTTTAGDMGRFASFLMGDGRVDGETFVRADLLRAMGRPHGTEAARAGLSSGYALGLGVRDRHGARGVCHGGSTVGYRAMFCLFPDRGRAFFVSLNADVEDADYGRFDRMLIDALSLGAVDPVSAANAPGDAGEWDGFFVLAPSRFETFAWLDETLGFARVRWNGRTLHLAPFQGRAAELVPVSGSVYRAADRTGPSHVGYRGEDGIPLISNGEQTWAQVPWWRLAVLWASLGAGLLAVVYLVLSGIGRVVRRRLRVADPAFTPVVAAAALFVPAPLFLLQPFLALGDPTVASITLAIVTAALPVAMLVGLVRHLRRRPRGVLAALDAAAMIAVLQLCVVLATRGLVPLVLWR